MARPISPVAPTTMTRFASGMAVFFLIREVVLSPLRAAACQVESDHVLIRNPARMCALSGLRQRGVPLQVRHDAAASGAGSLWLAAAFSWPDVRAWRNRLVLFPWPRTGPHQPVRQAARS